MRCILYWPAQQAPQGEGKGVMRSARSERGAQEEGGVIRARE